MFWKVENQRQFKSYEGIRLWDNVRNSGDIAYEALNIWYYR